VNDKQREDGGLSGVPARPRVAIVHDYLTQRGGAERAVLSLCRAFPDAPLHTSFYDPGSTFPAFREHDVHTLWLDRLVPLRRRYRLALPLLPLAFRTSRVDADVVICSSSGWAHGIRTNSRTVVYCYSPAKWLYRRDDYLGAHPRRIVSLGLRALDPLLRRFDLQAAARADTYLVISTFIASQVREVYGIEAEVVFPPAGLEVAGPSEPVPGVDLGFFLTVSRLLPYKNVAQIVEAFRPMSDRRLVVVGDGPERARLGATAPANVRFVDQVNDAKLRWLYANSEGLVAASREDFGLTPVEAAGFGKPVAALRWGGFLDTVVPEVTGVFFDSPEPGAIATAIEHLATHPWDANTIRHHAAAFSEERFIERIRAIAMGS
jgi:glycosyltransferase involved in cell wall biosynthesis